MLLSIAGDQVSASGLINVGSALPAAVSLLVAGYVIQKTGDWNLPFGGSIGLLLFGALFVYWMKPNERLAGAEMN